MAEFVSQHSDDLLCAGLFNQRVKQNDMLGPWESEKVSVTVSTTFGSVNHVEMLQRKAQT